MPLARPPLRQKMTSWRHVAASVPEVVPAASAAAAAATEANAKLRDLEERLETEIDLARHRHLALELGAHLSQLSDPRKLMSLS